MDEQVIDHVPLFASLPAVDRRALAESLRPVDIVAGTVFMREGDPGNSFCVVLQGQIEIIKALGTGEERLIRVQGAGSFVGEMALFDRDGLRTASVRAQSDVRLGEMTHGDFEALLQRRPSLAYEIVRVLSKRLREADNATINDLRGKNVQLAAAYAELKAAQAQIIEKERLERELELARQTQQSILPHTLPSLPGFDFGALMAPARAVGGDFYDFIPLGKGLVGLVIADVSDKGMPAAIFMALSRSLLRAEASRGRSPAQALLAANRHLLDMNDAGMFVTVLYGILDARSGEFRYARAGHELPLLFNAGGESLELPLGTGQMLGLFSKPLIDEQAVRIPPGGKLLLYTDGVTDSVNAEQEAFGLEGIVETVQQHHESSAQALCDHLLQTATARQGSVPQFDDFTLVIVRAQMQAS